MILVMIWQFLMKWLSVSVQVTVIFPIVIFFSFFFSHLSLPILQSIILPCLRYVAFKIIFHLLQGLVSRPSRTNDLNVKPLNTRVEKSTDTIPNETVRKNVEYHSWKKDFRDFHGIEPHPLTTAFAWLINNVTDTLRRSYFHSLSYQELLDMIITQDMKKNREFNLLQIIQLTKGGLMNLFADRRITDWRMVKSQWQLVFAG